MVGLGGSSGKSTTSLYLSNDLVEWARENPEVKLSPLVDKLLRDYVEGPDHSDPIEYRLEQERAKQHEAELEATKHAKKVTELEELLEQKRAEPDEALEEALDALKTVPPDRRTPDNEAIRTKADGIDGVNAEQLVDLLNERHPAISPLKSLA